MGERMFRSDETEDLCLSLSEMPSNFAKGGNRLTKNAQEVMVSGVLLKLLIFSKLFHFCIRKGNAQKITEGQLRTVAPFFLAHGLCMYVRHDLNARRAFGFK